MFPKRKESLYNLLPATCHGRVSGSYLFRGYRVARFSCHTVRRWPAEEIRSNTKQIFATIMLRVVQVVRLWLFSVSLRFDMENSKHNLKTQQSIHQVHVEGQILCMFTATSGYRCSKDGRTAHHTLHQNIKYERETHPSRTGIQARSATASNTASCSKKSNKTQWDGEMSR